MRRLLPSAAAITVLVACTPSDSVTLHLTIALEQGTVLATDTSRTPDRVMRVVQMRAEEFGVRRPVLKQVGPSRVAATLPRVRDPARLMGIIVTRGLLEFRITDMESAFAAALPNIDQALLRAGISARPPTTVPASLSVDRFLNAAPEAEPQNPGSLRAGNAAPLGALLFPGRIPGAFVVPQEDVLRVDTLLNHEATRRTIPRGLEMAWAWPTPAAGSGQVDRVLYALRSQPLMTGDMLIDAQASEDRVNKQSVVLFELTSRGAVVFANETRRHVNDYMAVMLDGRVYGQPPLIRGEIGRRGMIELGGIALRDAQDFALLLRTGALPVPIRISEAHVDSTR